MTLYDTTTDDYSVVVDALTRAVMSLVPAAIFEFFIEDYPAVEIQAGLVTVRVIAIYDDQGRYAGLEITEEKPELLGAGSWKVNCAMEDLPKFLPEVLRDLDGAP